MHYAYFVYIAYFVALLHILLHCDVRILRYYTPQWSLPTHSLTILGSSLTSDPAHRSLSNHAPPPLSLSLSLSLSILGSSLASDPAHRSLSNHAPPPSLSLSLSLYPASLTSDPAHRSLSNHAPPPLSLYPGFISRV